MPDIELRIVTVDSQEDLAIPVEDVLIKDPVCGPSVQVARRIRHHN
jgi:hypothetical protein